MEVKSLLKEWRIWVLLIALIGSLAFLGPHYERTESGDLTLGTNIKQGLELEGGTRMLLSVQSNNTSEAMVNNIKNILDTRVSAFGLTQTDIRTVRLEDDYRIQIEIAGENTSRIEQVISREGSFEARMPLPVENEKKFTLNSEHKFVNTPEGITVDGESYTPRTEFYLEGDEENGTKFVYINQTNTTANLEVVAYDGQDIQQVLTSQSRVTGGQGGYSFRFPVVISTESAERVQKISANYRTIMASDGDPVLGLENGQTARLGLYVDDKRASALTMAATFKREGNIVTQPSISGGAAEEVEARSEMKELQSILQSGRLPAPVQIESKSDISSKLGGEFASAAFISIVASLIAVGVLVYFRYRSVNIAAPIFITGSSEVFILVGAWFSTIATLDLASIAGIVAAVGTGVDDQIIIADESGREKIRSWKKRMKRAFFVIFTSAASTIGAMTPIVSPEVANLAIIASGLGLVGYASTRDMRPQYFAIGAFALAVGAFSWMLKPSGFALQAVQGFAVTTILGVMVGITITRPAYAKLLEHLEK